MHVKFEVHTLTVLELSVGDVLTMQWHHFHYDITPVHTSEGQTERPTKLSENICHSLRSLGGDIITLHSTLQITTIMAKGQLKIAPQYFLV